MTVTVIRIGDTTAAAQSNVSDRSKHTSWLALLATANFGYVGPPGSWGLDMRRIGKDECGLRAHLLKKCKNGIRLRQKFASQRMDRTILPRNLLHRGY